MKDAIGHNCEKVLIGGGNCELCGATSRDDFLKGEVRCSFEVSPQRKAIWRVLLDMLEIFEDICEKHSLRYYASGGTLLGAARHHGFIPWDDDIDVAMPREDYERLQQILPGELPGHLFMQTTLTDPEYDICHLKIRDSRTTAIEKAHAVRWKRRYNMGMFLDVFPLDDIPDDDKILRKAERKHRLMRSLHIVALRHRFENFKQRIATFLVRPALKILGNRRFYNMREDILRRIPRAAEGGRVLLGGGEFPFSPVWMGRREWYAGPAVVLPFEYLHIRAPAQYEKCLEQQYGSDWRTPKKIPACHSIDMNPGEPYERELEEILRNK